MTTISFIQDGILGLSTGDALGVPVEFLSRAALSADPVKDMRQFGTYNQPRGTWSDDTSKTLCLLESLSRGLDYTDIMKNNLLWIEGGQFTPFGEAFDIGNTTYQAIKRFARGIPPLSCGGREENDCGNGSLMSILPAAFYLYVHQGGDIVNPEAMGVIHNLSSLTHAHHRCHVACGIYTVIAASLIDGLELFKAIHQGVAACFSFYEGLPDYKKELFYFRRIFDAGFAKLPQAEIRSSGYVVHTLEAALWCLLTTRNYRECVLKAVNLGEDTDTTAAVAGGLAGICYGAGDIPAEWREALVRRDYILELCDKIQSIP